MHFNADTISITDVNVNHIRYLSTARATMTLNFAPSPVTTDSSRCSIHSLTGTDALVIISGHHVLPRASFHTSGICSLQSVSIQPTELQHYSTPQRASSSAAKLITSLLYTQRLNFSSVNSITTSKRFMYDIRAAYNIAGSTTATGVC